MDFNETRFVVEFLKKTARNLFGDIVNGQFYDFTSESSYSNSKSHFFKFNSNSARFAASLSLAIE